MCCRRSFAFGRRACLRLEPQRFNPAVETTRRKSLNLSNGCLRAPVRCRRSFVFLAVSAMPFRGAVAYAFCLSRA